MVRATRALFIVKNGFSFLPARVFLFLVSCLASGFLQKPSVLLNALARGRARAFFQRYLR